MIAIGVLGCGRIGQVHARSIAANSRARLACVADAMPDAAEALAAQTGAEIMTATEILSGRDIDAVIICTPTHTHCDLVEQALENGKAALCEKPLDLSSQRIRDCLDRIRTATPPLMIGFNRRFDPSFSHLQDRIARGEIGDVEMVTITSRDPSPPPLSYVKTSGGLFRDMMIHDLDMARFLLGEEPTEVFASGSSLVDPEIGKAGDVDTASATLKTDDGRICLISNSRRATYGYDQRIEVLGSKGMLRAGNMLESTVELANADGFRADPALHFFLERYMPAYQRELDHFLDCIERSATPRPDGTDGLRAQILADAADQSCKTGRLIKVDNSARNAV